MTFEKQETIQHCRSWISNTESQIKSQCTPQNNIKIVLHRFIKKHLEKLSILEKFTKTDISGYHLKAIKVSMSDQM